MSTVTELTNVTASYPFVFTAQDYKGDGNFRFTCGAIFSKDNKELVDKVKKQIDAVAKEAWPDGVPKSLKTALGDGDQRDGAEFEGNFFINAANKKRVPVVNRLTDPITVDDNLIYGGAKITMYVRFWADLEQKRVNAQLRGVQFVEHGEAFGDKGMETSQFNILKD